MPTTNLYGVAVKDVFGKWILPNGAIRTLKRARDHAHYLNVKGWDNWIGEITEVRVIPWGSRNEMRAATKATPGELVKLNRARAQGIA